MRYAYPCTLTPENGSGFTVSFPDVPEALTSGDDRREALEMAEDALAGCPGRIRPRTPRHSGPEHAC